MRYATAVSANRPSGLGLAGQAMVGRVLGRSSEPLQRRSSSGPGGPSTGKIYAVGRAQGLGGGTVCAVDEYTPDGPSWGLLGTLCVTIVGQACTVCSTVAGAWTMTASGVFNLTATGPSAAKLGAVPTI